MPSPPAPEVRHQDPAFVRGVFDRIAERYDLTNTLLCAGCDSYWRRRVAKRVQSWQPREILDLATGSGVLADAIQRWNPGAMIVGADFSEPMLRQARIQRGQRRLLVADALHLPLRDESFDVVTVAFGLRNMASWPAALTEMRRVLRPGGHVAVLDFSLPDGWLRVPYRFYLHRVLPRLAGMISREREGYEYLAESIESFPSGDAMRQLLSGAGFLRPTAEPLTAGIVTLYSADKT
jgi:demethylmenaquinone methyltransferase/2-methoxy-6-polyprenyl-1,4-benzoquinol methylase